jgi:hypothetical protein
MFLHSLPTRKQVCGLTSVRLSLTMILLRHQKFCSLSGRCIFDSNDCIIAYGPTPTRHNLTHRLRNRSLNPRKRAYPWMPHMLLACTSRTSQPPLSHVEAQRIRTMHLFPAAAVQKPLLSYSQSSMPAVIHNAPIVSAYP